jgi:hypothetical protein
MQLLSGRRRAWSPLIGLSMALLLTLTCSVAAVPSAGATPSGQAANQPPVATIGLPLASTTYRVGSLVQYEGSGTDPEDGSLPSSALRWQIIQIYCPTSTCQEIVVASPSGPTGTFTIPDDHGQYTHYEFRLTATDSVGTGDTKTVAIFPETVQVTLATSPPGLQVSLDGEAGTSPLTRTTTVGARHVIDTPSPQGAQGFLGWSDGGGQRHTIVAGVAPATYTADFDVLTRPTRSLLLNGTTAYAEAPGDAEVNVTGDWTIEVWFKDETPGGYNHDTAYLMIKGDTDANPEAPFLVALEWGSLVVGQRTAWTNHVLRYPLDAAGAGEWHHVAASFQATTRRVTLYLDAVQVAEGNLQASSTTGNTMSVSLGRNGTHNYWRGKLDDVRIWNVVRTAAAIQRDFHTELGNVPAGLVVNWKLDEGTGSIAADVAGVGEAAVLRGGADWSTDARSGPPPPDTAPPVISGVAMSGVTTSGATVTWRTDEESDSSVEYGPTAAYGTTATPGGGRVSSHTVSLSDLHPSTTYHYRVRSADAAGNAALSGDATFSTPADTVPPAIDGLRAINVTDSGATIVWTTSEPADSQVRYGPTFGYGLATPRDVRLVTSHAVQLTGLPADAVVHLQVVSADGAGNAASSGNFQLRTASPPPAPQRTACGPRPSAAISTQPYGPGSLLVTLTAGTSDLLPNNTIEVLRFGAAANARIEIPGQAARSGSFDVAMPAGTRQVTFVVSRVTPNQPTTVPIIVVDRCGDWRTFVGGGRTAF